MTGRGYTVLAYLAMAAMLILLIASVAGRWWWTPGAMYLAGSAGLLAQAQRRRPVDAYAVFVAGAFLAMGLGWLLWNGP